MCTTCSECVTDVYVGVKTHLCNVHALPCTSAQNTCSKGHVTLTAGCAHTRPCIYACTCMYMHMGAYARPRHCQTRPGAATRTLHPRIRVHLHTRAHVRVHGRTHICMYTHTCTPAHMYAYTSTHTRMWMYACMHASTPGTTAPQRQGEELIQTPESSHISPVQRNQPHLASPLLGLHCTHFLRPQCPSTPPPLFQIYPRTVHGPRQAWFYCPTLIVVQSAHHALPHSATSQLW